MTNKNMNDIMGLIGLNKELAIGCTKIVEPDNIETILCICNTDMCNDPDCETRMVCLINTE